MLATQLNNIATDNLIDKFSVVKLSKYLCNTVHNKKYAYGIAPFCEQLSVSQNNFYTACVVCPADSSTCLFCNFV